MKKGEGARCAKRISSCKEETYLAKIFSMLKARNRIVFHDGKTHFNDTELRLLSEIVSAMYEGNRLISTQLADLLGITRSAISQIVNRLEEQGVVQRVADEVDRKIAYIVLADGVLETYGEDLEICFRFLHEVVGKFGEERFFRMCDDFETFINMMNDVCREMKKEQK
ncbi:MAG: MarR family transcriptional regulator [Clostridia bacterium]|nr:MarR family transcriptional regulator [Clostridia bacterium]